MGNQKAYINGKQRKPSRPRKSRRLVALRIWKKRRSEAKRNGTCQNDFQNEEDEDILHPSLTFKTEEDSDIEIKDHGIQNLAEYVASKFENNFHNFDNSDHSIQANIQETDPIGLDNDIVNTECSTSAGGSHWASNINTPEAIAKQAIQNSWKNIVKNGLTTYTKQMENNLSDPVNEKNDVINTIELCVLCGKNVSKYRNKKIITEFLEMVLAVTGVEISRYKILPYACGTCYTFLSAIKNFQEQVRNAKVVIEEKLSHLNDNEITPELAFASVDTIDEETELHTIPDVNDQICIKIESEDEMHMTEIQNSDVAMNNLTEDTSEITSIDTTESIVNTAETIGNSNIITCTKPITELNIEEVNEPPTVPDVNSQTYIKIELDEEMHVTEIQNRDVVMNNLAQDTSEITSTDNTESIVNKAERIGRRNIITGAKPITELNIEQVNEPPTVPDVNNQTYNKSESKEEMHVTEIQNIDVAVKNLPEAASEITSSDESIVNQAETVGDNINTAAKPTTESNIEKVIDSKNCRKSNECNRKPPNVLDYKFMCSVCGKLYWKENYSKHMQVHKNVYITCKRCGKQLKRRSMRGHMRRHEDNQKPSDKCICSQCGKSYAQKSSLKKHEITHGEKKYSCGICKQSFHHHNYLKRHIRSHSGEKPYACSHCNKTFSIDWNFQQHLRLHTNSKPYKCQLCSAAFRHNVTLKGHLARNHTANEIASVKSNNS